MLPLDSWNREVTACTACPRLSAWCKQVAQEKRSAFRDEVYWGRPVPYFGDPDATHLIVGLAPAAHGANRTGRLFTGDRSGDWLYRALHKAGAASQAEALHVGDGLQLSGVLISAVCHCAPPDNKPLPDEIRACSSYLHRVLHAKQWRAVLCLGSVSWIQVHRLIERKAPRFGHGVVSQGTPAVVASYHPSQQNTFTGKLTEPMLDASVGVWLNL